MEKNFGTIAFYTRRPDGRRRVNDRRLFLEQEYLDHNPERRINKSDRRLFGDRRLIITDALNTFWKEAP